MNVVVIQSYMQAFLSFYTNQYPNQCRNLKKKVENVPVLWSLLICELLCRKKA